MRKKDIDKSLLRKLYEIDKIETKELEKIFNCSSPTIYSNLRKYNIPIRTISESIKNLCNKGNLKQAFKKGNNIWKHPNSIKTQFKKGDLRLMGENNPSKRPEVIGKIREARKGWKPSKEQTENHSKKMKQLWDEGHYTKERDKKISMTMTGKPKSEEHRKNIGLSRKGEKHPCFNNWSSREPYGKEFSPELKEQIRKRDNYRCQQCFRHQDELFKKCRDGKVRRYKLAVHHIDFNKQNNNPNNLISLCWSYHTQTNYNRGDWTNYFNNKIMGG